MIEWVSQESFAGRKVNVILKLTIDGAVDFTSQEGVLLDDGIVLIDTGHELMVFDALIEDAREESETWLVDLDATTPRLTLTSATLYDQVARSTELAKALAQLAGAGAVTTA
jgi:hypothetical protein